MDNKLSIFSSIKAFEDGQRIAQALSKAELVPQAYKNNIPNTMIALEVANRIGVSPFMVMQNLDVIKGKPSWSSTFIIAVINSSGRFKPLRFKFEGTPKTDGYGCRAVTEDIDTGERLQSPLVNWSMVKAEGWLTKTGSKWKTMPELMFQYRCASFFGRLYCPDLLKGMHSVEEIMDISNETLADELAKNQNAEIRGYLADDSIELTDDERTQLERVVDENEVASYQKAINILKQK